MYDDARSSSKIAGRTDDARRPFLFFIVYDGSFVIFSIRGILRGGEKKFRDFFLLNYDQSWTCSGKLRGRLIFLR